MRYQDNHRAQLAASPEAAAEWLLGLLLCRRIPDGTVLSAKITETEAYYGRETDSSGYAQQHPSAATMPLFQGSGFCCVYAGMLLLSCGNAGENVLIRCGADAANYYDGPLKLAAALQIDKTLHGEDILASERIWLQDDDGSIGTCCKTRRVGLGKAVTAADRARNLRFILLGSNTTEQKEEQK